MTVTLGRSEALMALARRWFEEGWNGGRLEVAEEIFAPDFVLSGKRVGPAGPQRSVRHIRSVFDPMRVTVDQQIADERYVVSHYTARGRHTLAPYRGIDPTGRTVEASGVQIWRVEDGRVVQDWNIFDEWGMVAQLRDGPR
ncbi:hypothetical protein GCM10010172_19290 [Paractinoplanes ferrugineus]|uniref:Ester cyclase n=1 Tax=Paractinoplanes ferrugineus TaxID=113564 RepID=A0A919J800_9ACTN|nr:ester cyclase [Actinoplanes ferrugineus]GIE16240.1 hypothetical protein Afe05nite_80800 [Actinoplanes ferrugineus]